MWLHPWLLIKHITRNVGTRNYFFDFQKFSGARVSGNFTGGNFPWGSFSKGHFTYVAFSLEVFLPEVFSGRLHFSLQEAIFPRTLFDRGENYFQKVQVLTFKCRLKTFHYDWIKLFHNDIIRMHEICQGWMIVTWNSFERYFSKAN